MTARYRFALAVAAASLLGGGCATQQSAVRVRPWERSVLADEMMDPGRDPLGGAMLEHVYFSREASSGGRGVGGSGCGCN
ncbi:MAG TPA: DUF4266 domain-containing protein [Opitutaceae bacterium]|jgi:hypothetical protein